MAIQLLTSAVMMFTVGIRGDGDPAKMKPVQTMNGGDSKVDFPMVRLIQVDSQWKELWLLHKGLKSKEASQPPAVDFQKNEVLVVFGGHMANVQAYDYVKTYAKDKTAVIQLSQNFIPPAAVSGMKHPFILLVLPKEPVGIEVQLDSLAKDGSHYWMTIASYRAPKPAPGS